jgi:hypothetical protein
MHRAEGCDWYGTISVIMISSSFAFSSTSVARTQMTRTQFLSIESIESGLHRITQPRGVGRSEREDATVTNIVNVGAFHP